MHTVEESLKQVSCIIMLLHSPLGLMIIATILHFFFTFYHPTLLPMAQCTVSAQYPMQEAEIDNVALIEN